MCENVECLDSILQPFLEDQTVSSYKILKTERRFRTQFLELEVCLTNGNTLYLIAKVLPDDREDVLLIDETGFRKEVTFYSTILPTLKQFERKEQVDELYFLPEYFGSANDDRKRIILLGNVRNVGYKYIKDIKGLDLVSTRQVLKDLASFHAVPIALKLKDDKTFEMKIKRQLEKGLVTTYSPALVEKIMAVLSDEKGFSEYLSKIREQLEEPPSEDPPRVPFSTLIHCDLCMKNIFTKTDTCGTPDIKIINFENCGYGSLAEDLVFFLYTSVQARILEEHIDTLIEFYHSNLVRVLQECRCNPTPFSLRGLLKEMKIVANESQIARTIFQIYIDNSENEDVIREKLTFAVKDFVTRGWL